MTQALTERYQERFPRELSGRSRDTSPSRKNHVFWLHWRAFTFESVASIAVFADHDVVNAPGLFFYLVKNAVLTMDALAPLLAMLPPEEYVLTNLREGEAFDSKRWPVANDAAFASTAARCLDEPALSQSLRRIEHARGNRLELRALARAATAQSLAAMGGDADLFMVLWPDATPTDLALFSAPLVSRETAYSIEALCHAHYNAADGLYAYHVSRGYPGPSAESAARIVQRAVELGKLHVDELIAMAMGMVR